MAVKDSVRAIPIAAFNSAGMLPAVWQAITPAGGLPEACFTIIIRNFSNTAFAVSYDANHINDVVPADSVLELNFQTNSRPNNNVALMKRGTHIHLLGAAGAGFIYLSGFYQENQ